MNVLIYESIARLRSRDIVKGVREVSVMQNCTPLVRQCSCIVLVSLTVLLSLLRFTHVFGSAKLVESTIS
jgi:hypothetical protein